MKEPDKYTTVEKTEDGLVVTSYAYGRRTKRVCWRGTIPGGHYWERHALGSPMRKSRLQKAWEASEK